MGGSGGRDQMLAVEILGKTTFQPREFPQSGSKANDGEKERKKEEDGNNNGQLRIANVTFKVSSFICDASAPAVSNTFICTHYAVQPSTVFSSIRIRLVKNAF